MNISNVSNNSGFFDNKYLIGIIMVIINLGARFIVNELNDEQKQIINSKHTRRLLIFLVVFMATKDIAISFLISFVVIMFLFEFFNENSEYSLIPKKEKNLNKKNNLDKNQKIDQIIEELKTI